MKAAVTSRILAVSSAGSCADGDRVHVDDAVDAIMRLLQLHEIRDCAEIIAEMQIAGRLHAGKDELGKGLHCDTAPISKASLIANGRTLWQVIRRLWTS